MSLFYILYFLLDIENGNSDTYRVTSVQVNEDSSNVMIMGSYAAPEFGPFIIMMSIIRLAAIIVTLRMKNLSNKGSIF